MLLVKKKKIKKEIRYRIFAFLYFFDSSIVFAKSQKEAYEFIDRFEEDEGPQMG
jgi:hypothetical protein